MTERSPGTREGEWYRDWFGEEYLALYPHRDEREAAAGVELYLRTAPPAAGPVLDLACGAGRHLRALRAAGRTAVGLDLSLVLLRRARRANGEPPPVVRGDMRALPFRDGAFAGVTNYFTSFGYFESPSEDRRVLGEIRRILRPGGSFLLDFLNASRVRRELVPDDTRRIGGRTVRQRRRVRAGVVCKRIEVLGDGGGDPEVFFERVRLYEPDELVRFLGAHGLDVEARYGDYRGAAFDAASPRLILTGRAA